MIRTIVIPDKQIISFEIPKDYVGKQIEVIAFAQGEELMEKKGIDKQKRFTVLHVDNSNYKFDRDEANER